MKRNVFFISDRTAITAENLGHSLLTQFPGVEFQTTTIPFIDSQEKAVKAAATIRKTVVDDNKPPLVFSSFVDNNLHNIIASSGAKVFGLFSTYIGPLEEALGVHSVHAAGQTHGMGDLERYNQRLDAVNFSLAHDDGIKTNDLEQSDITLIGVSRCGKTPTCLYLAMHSHLKAANYPLTDDDLKHPGLPACLEHCRDKLFGLSITPEQLSLIRRKRRPGGNYASLEQCRHEIARAEALFHREGIPFLQTTSISIEEISTIILRDRKQFP
ncbi:MAG: kinase/pyrophosphorylase [Gammaproteobacteria bacterium]|nr:kinase/pyrophosphorylase [Gammaproteobacteria bacterium]